MAYTCNRRVAAAMVAASCIAVPAAALAGSPRDVKVADRAQWRDGFYEGHGEGNVCIAFEVRGTRVKRLEVKGALDCGHRFRCTGQLRRSAPGAGARDLRVKRNGRFRHKLDVTRQPPRPGPPARRVATFITGKLNGRNASGTFRTLFEAGGSDRCDSGVLEWQARRVNRPALPPEEDPLAPLVP